MSSSALMTTDEPGQHRSQLLLKHGVIQPSIMTSPGGFTSGSNAPLDIVSPVQGNRQGSSGIHGTQMINCSTDSYPRKVSDDDPVTMMQLWTSVANAGDIGTLHSSWSGEVPAHLYPLNSVNSQHKSEILLSRPDMVKRMTSNQNEDETSKLGFASGSVKRAALNRDASARSNALKAQYVPDALRPDILEKRQVSVEAIDFLMDYFQQSRLNIDERPRPLTIDDSTNTDAVVLSVLTVKPVNLSSINRRTTIEAIAYDLGIDMDFDHNDDDNAVWPYRPSALSGEDCMSNAEYFLED